MCLNLYFFIARCLLTCSYGAKHMTNRPLHIIMWTEKWPNTSINVLKLANVVGNWPVADCYFELCQRNVFGG